MKDSESEPILSHTSASYEHRVGGLLTLNETQTNVGNEDLNLNEIENSYNYLAEDNLI